MACGPAVTQEAEIPGPKGEYALLRVVFGGVISMIVPRGSRNVPAGQRLPWRNPVAVAWFMLYCQFGLTEQRIEP